MKITQEEFESLIQNDRIEYLLREERLDRKEPKTTLSIGCVFSIMWMFVSILAYLLLLSQVSSPQLKIIAIKLIITYMSLTIIIFKVLIVFIILFGIFDWVLFKRWKRSKRDLILRFFPEKFLTKKEVRSWFPIHIRINRKIANPEYSKKEKEVKWSKKSK